MASICIMCQSAFDNLALDNICQKCRKRAALPAAHVMPLRPLEPCRRCHGDSFIRTRVRERAAAGHDHVNAFPAALSAGFLNERKSNFWADKVQEEVDLEQPVGIFEIYICRQCGFTEWYTRGWNDIPIGPEFGTEIFDTSIDDSIAFLPQPTTEETLHVGSSDGQIALALSSERLSLKVGSIETEISLDNDFSVQLAHSVDEDGILTLHAEARQERGGAWQRLGLSADARELLDGRIAELPHSEPTYVRVEEADLLRILARLRGAMQVLGSERWTV